MMNNNNQQGALRWLAMLLQLATLWCAVVWMSQPRLRWFAGTAVAGAMIVILWLAQSSSSNSRSLQEGFGWDPESARQFLAMQYVDDRQKVFDVNLIQEQQASQEELDYYLRHHRWPWSPETLDQYQEAVLHNPYVRNLAQDSADNARKLYNEAAIQQVLFWQSPEGRFLTHGANLPWSQEDKEAEEGKGVGSFAETGGLIQPRRGDWIRCNPESGDLERVRNGPLGLLGEETQTVQPLDPAELPGLLDGFAFAEGAPCNPCDRLQGSDRCAFRLAT